MSVQVLKRTAGLGDVLMLLPVARALKCRDDGRVFIATERRIAASLSGTEWEGLDGILDMAGLDALAAADPTLVIHDMNHPRHSLQQAHQVTSFLDSLGLDSEACDRAIRLPRPDKAAAMVEFYLDEVPPPAKGRVLLHPASGAMNRTWPARHWRDLADALRAEGHQVMAIGNRGPAEGKGAFSLGLDSHLDVVDKFGFWETLELMRHADLLISTDSAPIQMAGATSIAILGLYSITRGDWRLPVRDDGRALALEPECRFFPCYPLMYDGHHLERARTHFHALGLPPQNMLYEWCCDDWSYACLTREITVERVLGAALSLLSRTRTP